MPFDALFLHQIDLFFPACARALENLESELQSAAISCNINSWIQAPHSYMACVVGAIHSLPFLQCPNCLEPLVNLHLCRWCRCHWCWCLIISMKLSKDDAFSEFCLAAWGISFRPACPKPIETSLAMHDFLHWNHWKEKNDCASLCTGPMYDMHCMHLTSHIQFHDIPNVLNRIEIL